MDPSSTGQDPPQRERCHVVEGRRLLSGDRDVPIAVDAYALGSVMVLVAEASPAVAIVHTIDSPEGCVRHTSTAQTWDEYDPSHGGAVQALNANSRTQPGARSRHPFRCASRARRRGSAVSVVCRCARAP